VSQDGDWIFSEAPPEENNLKAIQLLEPDGLNRSVHNSAGIRAGNLLFIGGQVSIDGAGHLVGKNDIRAQAAQVYKNIATVLRAAGATVEQIVRLETYYLDVADRSAILDVRRSFLHDHRPCTVGVVVKSLADPDWLIEVQAIAVLD
jgi:enamine deaminase RidA (YjgF/YER057c/UK114 family)